MFAVLAALAFGACGSVAADPVRIGSKNFAESYLLGEIMAQTLEASGVEVQRMFGFGGTKICYDALRAGEIDIYAEYTGTIAEALLGLSGDTDTERLADALSGTGVKMLSPFGFNNTYVLAARGTWARELGLSTISDLAELGDVRATFSHEFIEREDGWRNLRQTYSLPFDASAIEHALSYQALAEDRIDVTDAYSTDGELVRFDVVLLDDDKAFFPNYLALPLVRTDLDSRAVLALQGLSGTLDDSLMRKLNAQVVLDKMTFADVATGFIGRGNPSPASEPTSPWQDLPRNTARHLKLTGIALLLACIAGLAIAILVYRSERLSSATLYATGLIQTVPSIALLALMIPLLGIGQTPAIVALFLYSLLPVVRNGITGLTTIAPVYRTVARAMGLTSTQRLVHVYLPLAAPHLLAGIRTAAVLSIGTATLAAFIGAGGLGDPIVTGLALNDTAMIMRGAIPAALLAIATEFAFSLLERSVVPAHMRKVG
jgi:osmoprotectant transport system permease protein